MLKFGHFRPKTINFLILTIYLFIITIYKDLKSAHKIAYK